MKKEKKNKNLNTEKENKKDKDELIITVEKKGSRVLQSNPLHSYKFWVKIFACILLIILAMMLFFKDNEAQGIVLMFTGGVFALYSLIRFIPLMKTLEKGWSKVLCFVEIAFDLCAGILLIALAANTFGKEPEGFVGWCCEHYNIVIGLVLWLRGFVYFTTTILVGEKTDKAQLFIHIGIITFGSFLLGVKIKAESIALALAIISLICGVLIGGEGFFDYGRYRRRFKETRTGETKKEEKDQGIEAPAREGETEEVPNDAPEKAPIVEPENDDRPFIS